MNRFRVPLMIFAALLASPTLVAAAADGDDAEGGAKPAAGSVQEVGAPQDEQHTGRGEPSTTEPSKNASSTNLPSKTARRRGKRQPTAEGAIARLREGNTRFVECHSKHPHEQKQWRMKLESGQHPFAVVLGCSDSRVPPELVFDQGLGDLFVVRVAGNVVDTDVIASIEYAVDHLEVPLVLVMGHSGCGAITAAIDGLKDPSGEPAEVISLLYQIEPATIGIDPKASPAKQVDATVHRNVQLAVRRLSLVPDLRAKLATGRIRIAGAVYDMHTGEVNFIGPKDVSAAETLGGHKAVVSK